VTSAPLARRVSAGAVYDPSACLPAECIATPALGDVCDHEPEDADCSIDFRNPCGAGAVCEGQFPRGGTGSCSFCIATGAMMECSAGTGTCGGGDGEGGQ
jgi:hypothetical protein